MNIKIEKILDTIKKSGEEYSFVRDERMDMLSDACEDVIQHNVEGDFVETGVYKGGMIILMSAINKFQNGKRKIYAYDSFEGCPEDNNLKYKYRTNERLSGKYIGTLENVKKNIEKFNLLDENIIFIKGWFKNTLIPANIPEKISILRFDADYYSSTLEVLEAMYDRVSVGGYIIIDDYCLKPCKEAVHEFLVKKRINANLCSPYKTNAGNIYQSPNVVDGPCGVYWKKDK